MSKEFELPYTGDKLLELLENIKTEEELKAFIKANSSGGHTDEEIRVIVAEWYQQNAETPVTKADVDGWIEEYLAENPMSGELTEQQVNEIVAAYIRDNNISGSVSAEEIAQAVENYIAEHPITGVTTEDIQNAVNSYLTENPVSDGQDGVSPTVEVTAITGGHRVTITDENGPHTFDIMNGADGEGGSGTVTDEQIASAVSSYLEENPTDLTLITEYEYSENLFNPKTDIDWNYSIQYGTKVEKTSARVEDGANWNWITSTKLIEIEEGCEYVCSDAYKSGAYKQIYLYDKDKKYAGEEAIEEEFVGTDGLIHFKSKTGKNIKYFASNINAYSSFGATTPYGFQLRKAEKKKFNTTQWQKETTELSNKPVGKREVDIVAFVGQSNMVGLAWSNDWYITSPILDEGVGYEFSFKNYKNGIDYEGCIKPAQNLFGIGDRYYSDDCNEANHIGGVQASLMKKYYEITGIPMVGISCSTSGRNIYNFIPKEDSTEENPSWCDQVIERVNACEEVLTSLGYTIKHKYAIWWQGESDGDEFMAKETYKAKFKSIMDAYKSNGIEKIFVIRIGNYNSTSTPHLYDEIQDAQTEICLENEDFVMASLKASALQSCMNDAYHFNQTGYNIIGADTGKNIAHYWLFGEEAVQYDDRTGFVYPYFGISDFGRPVINVKGTKYTLPLLDDLGIEEPSDYTFYGSVFTGFSSDLSIEAKYQYMAACTKGKTKYVFVCTEKFNGYDGTQIRILNSNGFMGKLYKLVDENWEILKFFNSAETSESIIDYGFTSFDYVNFDLYRSDGKTLILASNYDNTIDYSDGVIRITSLAINGSDNVTNGESITLEASFEPEDATNYNLVWSVDNTDIATITQEGVLSVTDSGNVIVTLKDTVSGLIATKNVTATTVDINITGIDIAGGENVKVGNTITLNAVLTPDNANNYSLIWSSSDDTKATVENGVVTGVAQGSATITVTDSVSGISDTFDITITENTNSEILEKYPQLATYFDEYEAEYPYYVATADKVLMSSVKPTTVVSTSYSNNNRILVEDAYSTSKLIGYNSSTDSWKEITSSAYKIKHGSNDVGFNISGVSNNNFYDAILNIVIASSECVYDTNKTYITSDDILSDVKNHCAYDPNREVVYPTICDDNEFLRTYYEKYSHAFPYFVYNKSTGYILISDTKPEIVGYGTYNYNKYCIMKDVYGNSRLYQSNWNYTNSSAYKVKINTNDVGINTSDISYVVSTEDIYSISDVSTMEAGELLLSSNV